MSRSRSKKRAYNKAWALANPEKMRESSRKYSQKPEVKARQKAYYAERRERTRELARLRYVANLEKTREYKREWSRRNRDRRCAALRAKRRADPEAQRAKDRAKWAKLYAKDPQPFLAQAHRWKARLRDAKSPGVTAREWRAIVDSFCGLCAYCLQPCAKPHREHVIALARGGLDEPGNVVPACPSCNTSKRDLSLLQWVPRCAA